MLGVQWKGIEEQQNETDISRLYFVMISSYNLISHLPLSDARETDIMAGKRLAIAPIRISQRHPS